MTSEVATGKSHPIALRSREEVRRPPNQKGSHCFRSAGSLQSERSNSQTPRKIFGLTKRASEITQGMQSCHFQVASFISGRCYGIGVTHSADGREMNFPKTEMIDPLSSFMDRGTSEGMRPNTGLTSVPTTAATKFQSPCCASPWQAKCWKQPFGHIPSRSTLRLRILNGTPHLGKESFIPVTPIGREL